MKTIEITGKEAILADYVLTLHQYNAAHWNFLNQDWVYNIRKQVGLAFVEDGGDLTLEEGDIKTLLILITPIYSIGGRGCGQESKEETLRSLA